MTRFHHPAVPIVLAAVLIDTIGFVIIVFSAVQGLVYPSMNALLSRLTDASHQGALQGGMSSINSVAAIIGPVATTQALAFGAEHGEPGGGFLLAALLVFSALLITVFGVVPRLRPAPAPALASE